MANFNGTQTDDLISGTNDDDVITGLGGDDVINGAGGNDDIDGGVGADNVLGGAGDDSIAGPDNAKDTIDGGDDNDTLVTDLADGDDLTASVYNAVSGAWVSSSAIINGVTLDNTDAANHGEFTNVENVQVSNASDFVIDLTSGADQLFAFDQNITSTNYAATAALDILAAKFDASDDTIAAAAGDVVLDGTEGVIINGTTYADGDTYTTAGGGSVAITFDTDHWNFAYTAAPQSTIEMGDTVEDEVLSVQVTDTAGNVISKSVALESTVGTTVNLDALGVTAGTRVNADDTGNTITDGAGMDTLFGGAGGDNFTIQSDVDNAIWAGANDVGMDQITITGNGNNIAAGGANDDTFNVGGNGANTLFGGTGADTFTFTDAEGNNTAWGGSDTGIDTFTLDADTDGNNVLGGGEGADVFTVAGDGNNTLYLGADDDNDTVTITGNGNNTIFGGAGEDGDGQNDITISGNGDNTVFNGNGNDTVDVRGAEGANTLYGGAGNDEFILDSDTNATLIFTAGNGNDELRGFEADNADHKIDLSDLGFADANDVLDSLTEDGNGDAVLFVTAGQTITFDNVSIIDLQAADPADWLIL